MYVKDYMTSQLITISPETTLAKCRDLMRVYEINRLPVMANNQLVGLVNRDDIIRNTPTDATSLSAHEVNYLLEKSTAKDIMTRKYEVVGPTTLLDEAAAKMVINKMGVVLVQDQGDLVGIITDKDIFKAFIDISGYYSAGASMVVDLAQDRAGVIEEIGDALVETGHNLTHMIVYHLPGGAIRLVMHVEAEKPDNLCTALEDRGYQVHLVESNPPSKT